jgi:hypothetical protein
VHLWLLDSNPESRHSDTAQSLSCRATVSQRGHGRNTELSGLAALCHFEWRVDRRASRKNLGLTGPHADL